jgi:hypothetical protein
MIKKLFFITNLCLIQSLFAQPFSPEVGQMGSIAVHYQSSEINYWLSDSVIIEQGWKNIEDTTQGKVDYGIPSVALNESDGTVISLGDGGEAIYVLSNPLSNIEGFDFAIFENSFSNTFLELAFVEVSSNGEDFFRFPSVSLTNTENQVDPFGNINTGNIHNLAGKYPKFYGTPFDLKELENQDGLNINAITHIKVIDVVGSIKPDFCTYDSEGNIVNDPWPTSFSSSGFDLDALAILNPNQIKTTDKTVDWIFDGRELSILNKEFKSLSIFSADGKMLKENLPFQYSVDLAFLQPGIYILSFDNNYSVKVSVQ